MLSISSWSLILAVSQRSANRVLGLPDCRGCQGVGTANCGLRQRELRNAIHICTPLARELPSCLIPALQNVHTPPFSHCPRLDSSVPAVSHFPDTLCRSANMLNGGEIPVGSRCCRRWSYRAIIPHSASHDGFYHDVELLRFSIFIPTALLISCFVVRIRLLSP